MKLYRFSPITSQAQLDEAITYVAVTATRLYFAQTGDVEDELIDSLTLFAHFPDEYEQLQRLALQRGALHGENNGPRVKLHQPLKIAVAHLERNGRPETRYTTVRFLRIRHPDPYRMQVGCCDLKADFYSQDFVYALTRNDHSISPRLIKRPTYDMLELFDPGLDVLAYVVQPHEQRS